MTIFLFHQAYIGALGDHAPERLRSAAKSILQEREVSRGERSYDVKQECFPIGAPMTKIAAKLQVYIFYTYYMWTFIHTLRIEITDTILRSSVQRGVLHAGVISGRVKCFILNIIETQ